MKQEQAAVGIPVAQKNAPVGEFSTGLCDCFSDVSLCKYHSLFISYIFFWYYIFHYIIYPKAWTIKLIVWLSWFLTWYQSRADPIGASIRTLGHWNFCIKHKICRIQTPDLFHWSLFVHTHESWPIEIRIFLSHFPWLCSQWVWNLDRQLYERYVFA